MMRLCSVAVLLVGLILISACAGGSGGTGRLELSATEYDFGAVPNTESVSQVFQVRNSGSGSLEITGLATSCGCTTAQISATRLAPGEVADLIITFDPQAHDGATGDFTRMVYLRSDDPSTPEATLTIHVFVVEA